MALRATFVEFQLMRARVLVLIVGNVIHASVVYTMQLLAADDLRFHILYIYNLINTLEKKESHCLF
jgi:hypothetical protein